MKAVSSERKEFDNSCRLMLCHYARGTAGSVLELRCTATKAPWSDLTIFRRANPVASLQHLVRCEYRHFQYEDAQSYSLRVRKCSLWQRYADNYWMRSYSRITSTKSPQFCMIIFSVSLTNLTVLLPKSRDYSCYVSKPKLHLHRSNCKNSLIYAHTTSRSVPHFDQRGLPDVTCAWTSGLSGINPAITNKFITSDDRLLDLRFTSFYSIRSRFGEGYGKDKVKQKVALL